MKLLHPAASITLLGLPSALAALAATTHPEYDNATPTRPKAALRVLGASPEPTGPILYRSGDINAKKEEVEWDAAAASGEDSSSGGDDDDDDDILRVQHEKRVAATSPTKKTTSKSATPPVKNPFTNHKHKTTASSSSSASPTTSAAAAALTTKVAVFTADGVEWTVTSVLGVEAVDGKTLAPGGAPVNVGGDMLSEPRTGGALADGATLTFTKYSPSSSSVIAGRSSGGAASRSSQLHAGGGSSSAAPSKKSPGGAMPLQTAGVGKQVIAAVGVVAGVMIL